jgi:hypothetical protein
MCKPAGSHLSDYGTEQMPCNRSCSRLSSLTRCNRSIVRLTAAAIVILTFAPILLSQTNQSGTDCKSLIMRSGSAAIEEVQPQKGEKYHQPPMVTYEVQENGDVRKLRLSSVIQISKNSMKSCSQQLPSGNTKEDPDSVLQRCGLPPASYQTKP